MNFFKRIVSSKGSRRTDRRRVHFRPGLQPLESRWVPDSFTWAGGTNSNFWLESNWQGGAAPPNDGTADISIYGDTTFSTGYFPWITDGDANLRSLHILGTKPLTLNRSALTLQNGGALTGGGNINTIDSSGGDDVFAITLAGGTLTWTKGIINPGNQIGQPLTVQSGATLHVIVSASLSPHRLGKELYNNGGTINFVGAPGGKFVFGNGRGLTNHTGSVTFTYNVTLERSQGGAPDLNSAIIFTFAGSTLTFRDGTITSDLPISNAGIVRVRADTQAVDVTIRNSSPQTDNVGMRQSNHAASTIIDADAGNATLHVDQGYKSVWGGSLYGLASSASRTPKLASSNGSIELSGFSASQFAFLGVGDRTHVNTTFVLSASQVTLGQYTTAEWYWQTGNYSKLDVQGALTVSINGTHASMDTTGTPPNGTQATVLTSTGTFTGTFATAGGTYSGGSWTGAVDHPNRRYVFTAN